MMIPKSRFSSGMGLAGGTKENTENGQCIGNKDCVNAVALTASSLPCNQFSLLIVTYLYAFTLHKYFFLIPSAMNVPFTAIPCKRPALWQVVLYALLTQGATWWASTGGFPKPFDMLLFSFVVHMYGALQLATLYYKIEHLRLPFRLIPLPMTSLVNPPFQYVFMITMNMAISSVYLISALLRY